MGQVIYEGVTFIVAPCAKMSKGEFIKMHIDVYWTDRDEATRKKMLTEAYALVAQESKKTDS